MYFCGGRISLLFLTEEVRLSCSAKKPQGRFKESKMTLFKSLKTSNLSLDKMFKKLLKRKRNLLFSCLFHFY